MGLRNRKWLAVLALASTVLFSGCLRCPQGTVKCIITEISGSINPTTGHVEITIKKYKTCVTPGTCPDPPWGAGTNSVYDDSLGTLGLSLAGGYTTLSPDMATFEVNSLEGNVGELEEASVEAKVTKKDSSGAIVSEDEYSGALIIREDRGSEWVFKPQDIAAVHDYIKEVAKTLVNEAQGETVYVEYTLNLEFASLPTGLTIEDFTSEFRLGGTSF